LYKKKYIWLSLLVSYFIFLLFLAFTTTKGVDEGTHSLLGVFYSDLIKYSISHLSFKQVYDYAYAYLIYYPKISVYYPPLVHLTIVLFFSLFGKSIFSARLVSIFFSILFTYLTYRFSIFLYKDKITAILTTFIFISIPWFIYLSRGVYLDLPMSFFFTLTMFLYLIGFKKNDKKYFIFSSIIAALGFFTKWQLILVFPILFLYSILTGGEVKRKIKYFLIFSIIFSVVITPYVLVMIKLGLFFLAFTSPVGTIEGYIGTSPSFTTINGWLYYPIELGLGYFIFPLCILTLIGIIYLIKDKKVDKIFILLWILVVYCFFTFLPNKQVRFLLPIAFPLSFITARYCILLVKKFGKVVSIVIILLIIFNIYSAFFNFIPNGRNLISFEKTIEEEVGNFLIENKGSYFMASETINLYPSNLMFYLAKNDNFIKGVRTCALKNKTVDEMNKTLNELGVKWIVHETNTDKSIVNSLEQKNIISFFRKINDITIYEYKFYNEKPIKNCNYICLTQGKICTDMILNDKTLK